DTKRIGVVLRAATWSRFDQALHALRQGEHLPVCDFVARSAHLPLQFPARDCKCHFPSLFLSGIARGPDLSRQKRNDDMTIAPAAERTPCAAKRSDNGSRLGRARAGKECDDDLLKASAPHPQIMDRFRVIL